MSTILFDKIVFGPIHSRRLGVSLGMNLLPTDGKLCSFNCIYCECGLNENHRTRSRSRIQYFNLLNPFHQVIAQILIR